MLDTPPREHGHLLQCREQLFQRRAVVLLQFGGHAGQPGAQPGGDGCPALGVLQVPANRAS